MAPRDTNQSIDSAESTVFGNLELDANNLNGQGDPGEADDEGQDNRGGDVLSDDERGEQDDPFSTQPDERRDEQGKKPLDDLRLSQTGKANARPLPKGAPVQPDAKGNLVDKDGKIVARAGSEARLYTSAHKARQELAALQPQLQDVRTRLGKAVEIATELNTELEKFKSRDAKLQEFKMTPEDHINALQLLSSLRTDTAGTLKRLLTRAAASGITIDSLGANAGVDAKGVLDLVREEIAKGLNPLKERSAADETQRRQQQADDAAAKAVENEVKSFFDQNPDARPFMPVFTKVLADPQYQSMSLGEVWARIQLNQERNNRSLRTRQTPRAGSPMSGRGAAPRGNTNLASVDITYNDILNSVLDEQGVT